MKWDAAVHAPVRLPHSGRAHRRGRPRRGDAGERVEREDLDGASSSARASSRIASRRSPHAGAESAASIAASRHSPSAACSPPPAAAVPRGRRFERRSRLVVLSERAQDPAEVDAGERRQAHVAGGFGLVDRELQRGGAGVVVTGLALRPSEAGDLVRLGLQEAETTRRLRRATEVDDGIVEPVLRAGQLAEHRVAADVQPRVVDASQPVLDLVRGPRRCACRSPAEIAARAANSALAAWSHGRSSPS